jgi:ABC-type Zn uptake system ZnuABC Zn-binding protein ZnuA
MRRSRITLCIACLLVAAAPLGCRPGSPETQARTSVAVTSPYLEAVVRDLLGETVEIVPMAGSGMCPGHFDIQPSRIEQLAACRLLLRFDFQQAMAEKLASRLSDSTRIVPISVPGGLCEPAAYRDTCRQAADALVEVGCLKKKAAEERLAAIDQRMKDLTAWMNSQIDAVKLRGVPVLTSGHQEKFCRALGLNVVATFSGGDAAPPSAIDAAVAASEKAGVKRVVANLPEGRRMADALAERLGATVIVFGNFPESDDNLGFDNLVRRNVNQLTTIARP